MAEKYVQVGITALRAPDGSFLDPVPLYIKEEDAGEINPNTGRTVVEDLNLEQFAKMMAGKFKQYKDGVDKLERERKRKAAQEV